MSNEKNIIASISRTAPLPGYDLKEVGGPFNGLDYYDRIAKSGNLTPAQLTEMFKGRTVATLQSEKYKMAVVTRPEFDAPPGTDHMIVVIPIDNSEKIPWDYNQFVEKSPAAAADFVTTILTNLDSYRGLGCSDCLAVLNTSAFDNGQLVDKKGEKQKKRLSQSMRFVHAKTYGYQDSDLSDGLPTKSELDLISRPLQSELNDLVRHVSSQLNISTYDEPGFSPIGIKLNNQTDFAEVYARVHEFMTKVSGFVIGPKDMEIDMSRPITKQTNFVHGVPLHNPDRVTTDQALKNINNFSPKLHNEFSSSSEDFHSSSTYFKNDDVARELVSKYLDGVAKYISENPNTTIPFGPHFTVMFEFNSNNEPVAYFIPADYVAKGANPVSGIIPTESHRPLTTKEKKRMKTGADNVINYLQETFGDERVDC